MLQKRNISISVTIEHFLLQQMTLKDQTFPKWCISEKSTLFPPSHRPECLFKSDFTVEKNTGIFKSRICSGLVLWQRHSRERHPLTRCYAAEGRRCPPQPHQNFPRSAEALSFGSTQKEIAAQLREKTEFVSCRRHSFTDCTRIQSAVWFASHLRAGGRYPRSLGLKPPKLNTRSYECHSQSWSFSLLLGFGPVKFLFHVCYAFCLLG